MYEYDLLIESFTGQNPSFVGRPLRPTNIRADDGSDWAVSATDNWNNLCLRGRKTRKATETLTRSAPEHPA